MGKKISVVVPVYNEVKGLSMFFDRTIAVMENGGYSYEILVVDDGSIDLSGDVIKDYTRRPNMI